MRADEREAGRPLSAAEQRRLTRFQETAAMLSEQGYRRTDLTIGIVKVNIFTLLAGLPIFAIGVVLFLLKNPARKMTLGSPWSGVLFLVCMLVLIVVHEGLHGIAWGLFAEHHRQDIEFGFMKEYLTPYCTCLVPLTKGSYVFGALMPLLVLGVIPTILAVFTGSFFLLVVGLTMVLGAGGDIMIVLRILRHRSTASEALYYDHPTQAGVVVFER